jgi:hypothetical protein
MIVAKLSDEKMKVFGYPFECNKDFEEFIKHLNENGKEVLGLFKKMTDPNIVLRVYYLDIEGEKTYPIVKVEFSWG